MLVRWYVDGFRLGCVGICGRLVDGVVFRLSRSGGCFSFLTTALRPQRTRLESQDRYNGPISASVFLLPMTHTVVPRCPPRHTFSTLPSHLIISPNLYYLPPPCASKRLVLGVGPCDCSSEDGWEGEGIVARIEWRLKGGKERGEWIFRE